MTSRRLIQELRQLFIAYGAPEEFSSDGGPQFRSEEFKTFCSEWGIVHHRLSYRGGVIGPWYCIMVLTCKIPVPPGPTHPWYQTVSDTCPSPGSGPTPRTIERPKTMYILSAILKYSIFKLFSLLSRCGTLYTVSDMDFLEFQKGS